MSDFIKDTTDYVCAHLKSKVTGLKHVQSFGGVLEEKDLNRIMTKAPAVYLGIDRTEIDLVSGDGFHGQAPRPHYG